MKDQTSGCHSAAAERFARFQERPDVKLITAKYADFVSTPEGMIINLLLTWEATSHLNGITTRHQYENAVVKLADKFGIPIADLKILAECTTELLNLATRQCSKPSGA